MLSQLMKDKENLLKLLTVSVGSKIVRMGGDVQRSIGLACSNWTRSSSRGWICNRCSEGKVPVTAAAETDQAHNATGETHQAVAIKTPKVSNNKQSKRLLTVSGTASSQKKKKTGPFCYHVTIEW
jgi:hypothetical protein